MSMWATKCNHPKNSTHTVAKISIEWEPILHLLQQWSATRVISLIVCLQWSIPQQSSTSILACHPSPHSLFSVRLLIDGYGDNGHQWSHSTVSHFEVEHQHCRAPSTHRTTHQFILIYTNLPICIDHAGAHCGSRHSLVFSSVNHLGTSSRVHSAATAVAFLSPTEHIPPDPTLLTEWWIAMLIRLN